MDLARRRMFFHAKAKRQQRETPAGTARAVRSNKPRVARVVDYAVPAESE